MPPVNKMTELAELSAGAVHQKRLPNSLIVQIACGYSPDLEILRMAGGPDTMAPPRRGPRCFCSVSRHLRKSRRSWRCRPSLDLTYTAVGATAAVPPPGYVVNHTRIKLGAGEKVFQAAKTALRRWEQFRLGWLEASPADTPIKEGQVVAILARSLGLWWLNACRIVTVVDGRRTDSGLPMGRYRTTPGRGGAVPD